MLSLANKLQFTPRDAAALLLQYPPTTLAIYDHGPSSGPDTIGPVEIGRLIVIEPLKQAVALALMSQSESAPWELLPSDTRLEDADPEGDVYWSATELYDFFDRIPDVGSAIASKVLHLKRPAFFPILDSVILGLYHDAARSAYDASPRARNRRPGAKRLYWAAVRRDLLCEENRAALAAIRSILRAETDSKAAQIATLSNVRLVDMLTWLKRA